MREEEEGRRRGEEGERKGRRRPGEEEREGTKGREGRRRKRSISLEFVHLAELAPG